MLQFGGMESRAAGVPQQLQEKMGEIALSHSFCIWCCRELAQSSLFLACLLCARASTLRTSAKKGSASAGAFTLPFSTSLAVTFVPYSTFIGSASPPIHDPPRSIPANRPFERE